MKESLYMSYYFTGKVHRKIGNNIRRIRRKRGLQQVEIAVDAGINPSYYGKIERGLVNPSLEKLFRILKALEVQSSEILPF